MPSAGSPAPSHRSGVVERFRDAIQLIATTRFGVLWTASLLSSIGTWTQQVAEPWLLLTLRASPFLVGLDAFAASAPSWLLTLTGGWIADRFDRRRVIALFQSIQMLCPIAIVALLVTHRLDPWMIIALSTIVGVTDALSMPSFQSIVPTILPRDQVARGLELNSTQYNLSRILGPAIAGGLLATVGPVACFAINAASYVPFVGVAVWILPPRAQRPLASGDPDDGRISIGSVFRADGLRTPLLTVLANAVLIAPLMTFIPVLVKHVFAGSATDFSMAVVAFGIGGLVGAAVLLALPSDVSLRAVSASAAAFDACVLLLIGMTRAFVWCVPLLALAGAGLTISNTAANSWLQTTTDRRRLGRTISLYMLALGGGSALGALATGVTVSALGVQRALMLNAVLALGAQGALLRARGDGGRS